MKYHTLANGDKMPLVGLGTLLGIGNEAKPNEVENAVETAIECGYRYIDCAWIYFNEGMVGTGIKNMIKKGVVKREDLFIATKLHVQFLRKELVRKGLMESLKALGLDYLDLYIIHAPTGVKYMEGNPFAQDESGKMVIDPVDHMETWKVLEELVKEGFIRHIGLSNFNHKQIQRIYDNSTIKPENLQVECHVYFQQKKLHDFCKNLKISFTAYSPIGSPGRPTHIFGGEDYPVVLEDKLLKEIADSKGKKPSQIALRYLVERGISVIPKSTNPVRIKENFDIFDFELTAEDIKKIDAIDTGRKIYSMGALVPSDHPDNPEKEPF